MGAGLHVVGDLDEVIDLASLADDGATEAGAIDGGIGPNLDVITDLHNAGLRNLDMPSLLELITKATGTDDGTRLKDHSISKDAALTDDGAGMKVTTFTKAHFVADQASGSNHGIGSDHSPLSNHGQGTDGDTLSQGCRGCHNRRGMDTRCGHHLGGCKGRHDRGKGGGGISHPKNYWSDLLRELHGNKNGRGLAGAKLSQIAGIPEKSDITRTSLLQGGDTGDLEIIRSLGKFQSCDGRQFQ